MSGKAFENEYISRREAIKARKLSCDKNCLECDFAIEGDSWCNGEVFVVDLLRIPPADVRPVVRGVWRRYSPFTDTYECSNCGEQVIDQQFRTNYCPNCGADMRETNT